MSDSRVGFGRVAGGRQQRRAVLSSRCNLPASQRKGEPTKKLGGMHPKRRWSEPSANRQSHLSSTEYGGDNGGEIFYSSIAASGGAFAGVTIASNRGVGLPSEEGLSRFSFRILTRINSNAYKKEDV